MFSPLTIALGLGVPFALACGWFGFVRRGPGRTWSAPWLVFGGVFVLGLAAFAGALGWEQSRFAPRSGSESLGWFALLWGTVAALDAAAFQSDRSRLGLRFVALTIGFVYVFGARFTALSGSAFWPALGLGLATAIACEVAALAFRRVPSPIAECAPLAACAGASALALFAGYATLASVAGATALAFAVPALGATLPQTGRATGASAARAGGAIFAVGWLVALALAAQLFGAPNYSSGVWALVALGFFAPAVIAASAFERFGAVGRFVLAAVLALAPIGLAAWLAYQTYAPNPYA
ncbi:MAG: hypothetical protein L6Q99_19255 [Planctomycetes bacterium]|nr:hypothetical protein [Planctomycetota bacterium]